jgi:hypothetical protein
MGPFQGRQQLPVEKSIPKVLFFDILLRLARFLRNK